MAENTVATVIDPSQHDPDTPQALIRLAVARLEQYVEQADVWPRGARRRVKSATADFLEELAAIAEEAGRA